MVNFPESDSPVWIAPWLIIGLGAVLFGIAGFNFYQEILALTVLWPPVVALLINLLLAGGLFYAGWWLRSTGFQPREQ